MFARSACIRGAPAPATGGSTHTRSWCEMTTELVTPKVAIDQVDIVEDFNARKKFDAEKLKQLAQTIKETGLVQPIRVREKKDGRFDLVAGERRFRAAVIAGRKEIEITLST